MLELVISVLFAFGFSFDGQGKLVGSNEYNKQEIVQQVKSNPDYEKLGGDDALNSIAVVPDVDPR